MTGYTAMTKTLSFEFTFPSLSLSAAADAWREQYKTGSNKVDLSMVSRVSSLEFRRSSPYFFLSLLFVLVRVVSSGDQWRPCWPCLCDRCLPLGLDSVCDHHRPRRRVCGGAMHRLFGEP